VTFLIGSHQYSAVVDTGCEALILSTQMYDELRAKGVESLQLSTQVSF
jgi:predicted aspartyl protease